MGRIIRIDVDGNAQNSSYVGTYLNYSALVFAFPSANFGDFAIVEDSEGTAWLPWTLGGTYYPAGTYYWDGTEWTSNVVDIAAELEYINNKFITSVSVTADYTANASDFVLVSTGAFTRVISLPTSPVKDDVIFVSKVDSSEGQVVIEGGTKNINGKPIQTLNYQFEVTQLHYTGSQWAIINEYKPPVAEHISTTSDETKIGASVKLQDGIILIKADIIAITQDGTLGYSNVITATVRVNGGAASIVGVEDSIENSDFPVGATSTVGVISDDVFISVTGSAGELMEWDTKIEIV